MEPQMPGPVAYAEALETVVADLRARVRRLALFGRRRPITSAGGAA